MINSLNTCSTLLVHRVARCSHEAVTQWSFPITKRSLFGGSIDLELTRKRGERAPLVVSLVVFLAGVMVIEKAVPHGQWLSPFIGFALLLLAVLWPMHPGWLVTGDV